MKRSDWSKPITDDEARRRAGGRARYNARRSDAAIKRRVYRLLPMLGGMEPSRGDLDDLARRLHVSKATVSRDVASLRRAGMLKGNMSFSHLRALAKVGGLHQEIEKT